jgi:hypothetical protein
MEVILSQDPNDSSGGAEHKSKKRPSTRAKHQAGQAAKIKSRGGEEGDIRRDYPRKPPKYWRGGWPPVKFGVMGEIIIQVSEIRNGARQTFKNTLHAWALQSRLVDEFRIEEGGDVEGCFWNLRLKTKNCAETWTLIGFIVRYYDQYYRLQKSNAKIRLRQESDARVILPPTIVVATSDDSWEDFALLHHTYPEDLEEGEGIDKLHNPFLSKRGL